MRIVAVLVVYNEEAFMPFLLEHLWQQGVEVYILDNQSTDRTVQIAQQFRS